jgi:nucleoside phosphorylase
MTPIPLALVAALEDEIRTLRSRLSGRVRRPAAAGLLTTGTWGKLPLLLVRTGMGPGAMARAINETRKNFAPALALLVGYSGAALADLRPGHLVIATSVIETSRGLSFSVAPELAARAEALRRQTGLPGRCGPLATVARPALTPQEKAAVFGAHQALAVDLESAAFAGACQTWGLPFLVVRAILDPLEYNLTAAVPGKNPVKMPPLSDFAALARRSLTAFTAAWLDSMNKIVSMYIELS